MFYIPIQLNGYLQSNVACKTILFQQESDITLWAAIILGCQFKLKKEKKNLLHLFDPSFFFQAFQECLHQTRNKFHPP